VPKKNGTGEGINEPERKNNFKGVARRPWGIAPVQGTERGGFKSGGMAGAKLGHFGGDRGNPGGTSTGGKAVKRVNPRGRSWVSHEPVCTKGKRKTGKLKHTHPNLAIPPPKKPKVRYASEKGKNQEKGNNNKGSKQCSL